MPAKTRPPQPAMRRPATTRSRVSGEASGHIENNMTKEKQMLPSVPIVGEVKDTDGIEVGVSLGFTENLGDFNSAKMSVFVKVPSTHDAKDADLDAAYEFADKKLSEYRSRFLNLPSV